MKPRCWALVTAVVVLALFLGLTAVETTVITVEPGGATIQSALDIVSPGDTISITSGIYFEDLKTRVDGNEDARITIQGVGGAENVIIRGTGEESRVVQVQNDYYTIQDFTIDGQAWNYIENVDEDNYIRAYRDILIYVAVDRNATERTGGYMSALDGLVITGMIIQHALSECVRLRQIYDNIIQDCGMEDYIFSGDGENGEGICEDLFMDELTRKFTATLASMGNLSRREHMTLEHVLPRLTYLDTSSDIGTALAQWGEEKNFSGGEDICLGNIVRDNEITTNGNEGVDVKEGCLDTVIENNNISMQRDENAGA